MSLHTPILSKNFTASAAVPARRLVKLTADGQVAPATTAADQPIGVSAEIDAAANARVDVHMAGIADVTASGAIARGADVVAAADGKAAAGAAAADRKTVGIALVAAVADGDLIPVLIAPSVIDAA